MLGGFYRPDAGAIRLGAEGRARDGRRGVEGRPAYAIARAGVARTYQTSQLFGSMSVLENLTIAHARGRLGSPFAAPGEAAIARARALAAYVGYRGDLARRAADLPHVDRRLVEIARALATGPRVLLLDEPAAGLSRDDKRALAALLRRIADRGIAVVLVEHDMSLVMGISDQRGGDRRRRAHRRRAAGGGAAGSGREEGLSRRGGGPPVGAPHRRGGARRHAARGRQALRGLRRRAGAARRRAAGARPRDGRRARRERRREIDADARARRAASTGRGRDQPRRRGAAAAAGAQGRRARRRARAGRAAGVPGALRARQHPPRRVPAARCDRRRGRGDARAVPAIARAAAPARRPPLRRRAADARARPRPDGEAAPAAARRALARPRAGGDQRPLRRARPAAERSARRSCSSTRWPGSR